MKKSSKIVVLGSTGQLGRALRNSFKSTPNDWEVTYLSRKMLNLSRLSSIQKLKDYTFDILINTAAYTAVDKAEKQQQRCAKINALALEELAAICNKKKAFIIHYSTDYVYDNNLRRPLLEEDSTDPKSTYAITKLLGEKLLRAICRNHYIIRTSWLYSAEGQNFLNTMLRLAQTRDEIAVVSDQEGTPTYTGDLADFTVSLIQKHLQTSEEDLDFFGTYNFSNSGQTTWHGFAEEIFKIAQLPNKVIPISTSDYQTLAKRPAYSVLDCTKIETLLGREIPDWKDALQRCMKSHINA